MNFIFKEFFWIFLICAIVGVSMTTPDIAEKNSIGNINFQLPQWDRDTIQPNFTFRDDSMDSKKCFKVQASEGSTYRWWFDIYKDSLNARSLANPIWQSMDENPCFTFDAKGCYYVALEVTHVDRYTSDTVVRKVCNNFTDWIKQYNTFVSGLDSNGNTLFFNLPIVNCNYYLLNIYNRWGNKVFHSDNETNDWDGKIMNTKKEAPEGVYMYQFKYKRENQMDTSEVFGTVTLIKSDKR